MGLLDGQIKNAIAAGLRGKLLTATIRKETVTGRDSKGDSTTTTTDYAAQGFQDTYSAITRIVAGIPETDVRIVLIAGLCAAVPGVGDKVQISGQWYQVRNLSRDPAGATYELQSFAV